ncbi:MAG: tetratricopeptide repeat protein [Chitinivibrionales bacterium]|nr:tetratricopeptide repeat protein [Chitinivibrionales bacterium]
MSSRRPIPAIVLVFIVCQALFVACGGKKTMAPKALPSPKTERALPPAAKDSAAAPATKDSAVLTPASRLMLRACDNYLALRPDTEKSCEVLSIKASIYYNTKMFPESRTVYQDIIGKYPKSHYFLEALRMVAQSFYEQKQFDQAQVWYQKLRDNAGESGDKREALSRIAESMFRMAEQLEAQQRYEDASAQYERVAREFPDALIADVALYNAGLSYERLAEWSRAVLMYQRLSQQYTASRLLAKALFQTAKCYEKMSQWENAGQTYLRVVASYPKSEVAPTALYNAGFAYENAEKPSEAAAVFEKMSQLYASSADAADVLFRAGELYGKIKDWEGVGRVNRDFFKRFGNDQSRVVQALCMVGIALYMQNKQGEAMEQLNQTIATFKKLRNPSAVNKYYAAKAQFTLGEITHEQFVKIALVQPRPVYNERLKKKSELLDQTIDAYSRVLSYGISEWITRSINQIGQSYEDFAMDIFKQQRPPNASLEERLALELGIAQAVENYFVNKALHFHEQNVKLGIKEKIEDKYIAESHKKLTYLPMLAGENYLALVEIARSMENKANPEGFALIAAKLNLLQKIAPYQERAINLFLKCLEMGTTYQEFDDLYKKASAEVTKTSFSVGQIYAEVSQIAREAPIPATFDDYEKFVYETKLLKQVETYDDQALTNLLKTIKIGEAYKIDDEYVKQTRQKIADVLFMRGRCYDLLCLKAFKQPPFPKSATAAEQEEFKARFEEVGLQLQQQAFDIYKNLLAFADSNFAAGPSVTHAYMRLYQDNAQRYGEKRTRLKTDTIASGPQWLCQTDTAPSWQTLDFDESHWVKVQKVRAESSAPPQGFPAKAPAPMWYGTGNPADARAYQPAGRVLFRRTFFALSSPQEAQLYYAARGSVQLFVNGEMIAADTAAARGEPLPVRKAALAGKLREGKNVVALSVVKDAGAAYGCWPLLVYSSQEAFYAPRLPGRGAPLDSAGSAGNYVFPKIQNFELK